MPGVSERGKIGMRKAGATLLATCLLICTACGGDAVDPADEILTETPVAAPAVDVPPPIYDEEGNLLASELSYLGLSIPRGLTLERELSSRHVYRAEQGIAIDKVKRFFGPRLVTGAVDQRGAGSIYRDATVADSRDDAHLDVSIMPSSRGGVRVEIRYLPAVPEQPLSDREVREILKQGANRVE